MHAYTARLRALAAWGTLPCAATGRGSVPTMAAKPQVEVRPVEPVAVHVTSVRDDAGRRTPEALSHEVATFPLASVAVAAAQDTTAPLADVAATV